MRFAECGPSKWSWGSEGRGEGVLSRSVTKSRSASTHQHLQPFFNILLHPASFCNEEGMRKGEKVEPWVTRGEAEEEEKGEGGEESNGGRWRSERGRKGK